jgi:hypothetical protein
MPSNALQPKERAIAEWQLTLALSELRDLASIRRLAKSNKQTPHATTFRFWALGAAPAMAVRSLGLSTTKSSRDRSLASGKSSIAEGRRACVALNGEPHRDHWSSLRCDELEAMLIYSMSVSVDALSPTGRAGSGGWRLVRSCLVSTLGRFASSAAICAVAALRDDAAVGDRSVAALQRAGGRFRRRLVRDPEGRLQPQARQRSGQRQLAEASVRSGRPLHAATVPSVRQPSTHVPAGHQGWAAWSHDRHHGMATPVPQGTAVGSAASHGVSIVSSKLFPSILT